MKISFVVPVIFAFVSTFSVEQASGAEPPTDEKKCPKKKEKVGQNCTMEKIIKEINELIDICIERFKKISGGNAVQLTSTQMEAFITNQSRKNLACVGTELEIRKLADCAIHNSGGKIVNGVWTLTYTQFNLKYCCPKCKHEQCNSPKRHRKLKRRQLQEQGNGGDDTFFDEDEDCPYPASYGEPHFAAWRGHYNYQGACDLVLLTSSTFNDDAGIDLHVRTEQMDGGYYSFISDAALRIGDDVLEIRKDRSVHHNKVAVAPEDVPALTVGGFPVTYTDENKCFDIGNLHKCVDAVTVTVNAAVDGPDGQVVFKIFTGRVPMVNVEMRSMFYDLAVLSEGMLGNYQAGRHGRLARDEVTLINDPNEFAMEWQVLDTDPKLFAKERYPQYPEQCIPPSEQPLDESPARMLRSDTLRQMAHNACQFLMNDDRDKHKNCITDVMSTEDEAAAIMYHQAW